jgi:hypothetical protein
MANGTTPSPVPPSSPSNGSDQKELAKRVSTIVLIGTCAFGLLGITMAIISMFNGEGTEHAKEILQILFSAILPLFGTWIGTVLAYYFSKENLKAANDTVQHLVNTLSSSKKLEITKARDVMIPLANLKHLDYPKNADDTQYNLKTNFLDYIKKEGISRVILLDENNAAKYVLHKSVIEGFIAQKYFQLQGANAANVGGVSTTTLQDLTFADMKKDGDEKIQAILKNGVKFISEDANLADARLLMQNFAECNDVFITKNGTANETVLGWITDKTIAENSIV